LARASYHSGIVPFFKNKIDAYENVVKKVKKKH